MAKVVMSSGTNMQVDVEVFCSRLRISDVEQSDYSDSLRPHLLTGHGRESHTSKDKIQEKTLSIARPSRRRSELYRRRDAGEDLPGARPQNLQRSAGGAEEQTLKDEILNQAERRSSISPRQHAPL